MMAFWVMTLGLFVWTLGCYVCCAIVVTAPIGAFVSGRIASRRGLEPGGFARSGAWYWVAGFVPWVCYLRQLNNRPPPRKAFDFAYRCVLAFWLVGPVVGGGMVAAGSGYGSDGRWLFVLPLANLAAMLVSVMWRSFGSGTSLRDGRLRSGDVAPFFLATLGMLSLLAQAFLVPWLVWLLS